MVTSKRAAFAAALASTIVLLGSCAHRNSAPGGVIVDMKGVDQVQYQRDLAECGAYADQVDTSGKVVGGAAAGAVVAGAVGGIFGGTHGASQGAGAGAVVGGAKGAGSAMQERNQVVRTCLRNRGYSVLN
jgi:uncharacterized protein YcfJ